MGFAIHETRLPCSEVLLILGFLALGSVQARVSAFWKFRSAGRSFPAYERSSGRSPPSGLRPTGQRGDERQRKGQERIRVGRMQCSKDSETWALHPSMVHWPTRGARAPSPSPFSQENVILTAVHRCASLRCCCAGPNGRKPSGLALKEDSWLIHGMSLQVLDDLLPGKEKRGGHLQLFHETIT